MYIYIYIKYNKYVIIEDSTHRLQPELHQFHGQAPKRPLPSATGKVWWTEQAGHGRAVGRFMGKAMDYGVPQV